jgi:hypothetical protein
MDRKRTGMSLDMVVEEEDYFFHSSSSSSSSDSEDDHDWLDSAFMGSFWVKDPNEERDRERWMASKLGIQCIARRLEKEARHTIRARVRAEKKEARKRQRLAHLQRIEEDKRREQQQQQQQQQQLLILQASLLEESLRPPLMVSEILKARRRRKSEGGYGDQRVVTTHSPVYGLMDGGSRIGESGQRGALFLKPRSLSTNEYSDDSSANDESDGDLSVPVPAPLGRRVSVDVDDEESDESNNSDSGSLGEEGRTLSFDTLDSAPEVRPGAAFKLEFKRRWSLNFATTVQAVNPPLDSSNLSSPTSPAISPSSATTSPLTTPTSPTPSSPSSLSVPAPSPLSSGSQSPSSFRYLSWVREGGSLILNRDKGKRERRGSTFDGDKKAAAEWRKRTREKAAEGESAQGLHPDAAGRLRSCTVSAVAGTGDLQVLADEAKKRSVSVGNKSDTLRVEPPSKSKGKRADNKSEVMFDNAPSSEDTTSTTTSTSTSTSTSSTTTTSTPTSGPSAEMTSSTSSFERIKRQLSGGLDKRRRGIMLSRSRSLTDRNRGSLEGYFANETVTAEASGPDTQPDSYPSVTVVQLQYVRPALPLTFAANPLNSHRNDRGSENGGKCGSKPGSPVQPRSKTVTKELRTSKSCRNYRAAVGLSGLSTSGSLLTNNSSSSSGPVATEEPVDAGQQRKLEKERRKEEKQREKAEKKEREREREREKEQQKELLRRSRRATDVSTPSPAASPRSFMSRLSGVPG